MVPNSFLELKPIIFLMNLTCALFVTYDRGLAKFVANRTWHTKLRVLTLFTGVTILLYHSYPPIIGQMLYTKSDKYNLLEFVVASYLALFFSLNGYFVQDLFLEMVENFKEIDIYLLKLNGCFKDGILHKIAPLVAIFMLVVDIILLCLFIWFYGMEGITKCTAVKFLIVLMTFSLIMPLMYFYLLIWEKFVVINNLIKECYGMKWGNCAVCEGRDICYERICPEHKVKLLITLHGLSCSAVNHWNDMFAGKSCVFLCFFECTNIIIFIIFRLNSRVPPAFASIFVNTVNTIMFVLAVLTTVTLITFTSMEANETATILHRLYLKLEKCSEGLKSEIASASIKIFQQPVIYYILTYELNTNFAIIVFNSAFALAAIMFTFKITPDNM